MRIIMILGALGVLFVLSALLVCKIKTKKQFIYFNVLFLAVGLVLLWCADFSYIPSILYAIFFAWIVLGMVGYFTLPRFSGWIEKICCKLFRVPYFSEEKEDDFENAHNESIKMKYYMFTIMVYVLYLVAVLPQIQI